MSKQVEFFNASDIHPSLTTKNPFDYEICKDHA